MALDDVDRELRRAALLHRLALSGQLRLHAARTDFHPPTRFSARMDRIDRPGTEPIADGGPDR